MPCFATIKAFSYLTILPFLLVDLAHHTSASPIASTNEVAPRNSHALSRRQQGTYDGSADDLTGRPGTYHCFKGGQFRSQAELQTLWPQACSTAQNITYDTHHFSYVPSADGTYPEQSVTHEIRYNCEEDKHSGLPACDGGATSYLEMTAQFRSAKHANEEDCMWAMQHIVGICHGGNEDSRGGWWQFQDDGTTYKIDPQGIVDGKHQ